MFIYIMSSIAIYYQLFHIHSFTFHIHSFPFQIHIPTISPWYYFICNINCLPCQITLTYHSYSFKKKKKKMITS